MKKMIGSLGLVFLLIHSTLAQDSVGKNAKTWLTLNGAEPVVIARGGFSGLFPDSSNYAFELAKSSSLAGMVLFCDLQLTKDAVGVCQTTVALDNSTTIGLAYPDQQKTYNVNGNNIQGWFALDYTSSQLFKDVYLTQNIFTRPSVFDGTIPIAGVEDALAAGASKFWLNVQYDTFYNQHGLSAASYIERGLRGLPIDYISSPEIGFLKSMNGKVNKAKTKLIFRFLEEDELEPTTNVTYGSILENLSTIKTFASGILVPKQYIWPVNAKLYIEAATSLVADAHKQGLEVYASGFANDYPASYNYSYDPTAEYLQFIDNSQFSVDGFLTDFPSTASESIACLAHNKNATKPTNAKALVISHNGASGMFAGSTDLAYQQAIDDGADIIDCSVQMSKDGVAFCSDSPDLTGDTTALPTFMSRSTTIPEIQKQSGVFSFDLSWSEIQSLKPQLSSPFLDIGMMRNPANKSLGNFMTLSAFLELAKTKAVTGILINIENAAYLASKKGLDIANAVATALRNATFDQQSTQKVLIQSDDSSVLAKFRNISSYQRVMSIKETISTATEQSVQEIKKYANAVTVPRASVITTSGPFVTTVTNVVSKMHAANISVYVAVLRNEFITLAFDYFSDPMVELATYLGKVKVDGVITDFPETASSYLRSPCSNLDANLSYTILPVEPGSLLELAPPEVQPPAAAPAAALEAADVVDPPLPEVSAVSAPPPDVPPSSGSKTVANIVLTLLAFIVMHIAAAGL